MTTTELIIYISTKLGWNPTPLENGCVQMCGGTGPEIVWPSDPIKFAAYAQAEMAKRGIGYEQCASVRHKAACIGWGSFDEPRWKCNQHEYDPTDPISEAAAVLRCCADALQSNA